MAGDARFCLVFLDQFRLGVEEDMHVPVREEEEEGLPGGVLALDEVETEIGEAIGHDLVGGILARRVEADVAKALPDVGLVKAAPQRMILRRVAEMPFAEHRGGVTALAQGSGHGGEIAREVLGAVRRNAQRLVGPPVTGDPVVDADARGGLTRHQGGACRRANRGGVGAGETHPLRREMIQPRRLVEAVPVGRQIGPAKVVGEDEDEVGACGLGGLGGNTEGAEERGEEGEGEFWSHGAEMADWWSCSRRMAMVSAWAGSLARLRSSWGSASWSNSIAPFSLPSHSL